MCDERRRAIARRAAACGVSGGARARRGSARFRGSRGAAALALALGLALGAAGASTHHHARRTRRRSVAVTSISHARARQIQLALEHAGYLRHASGRWDATTRAAMKRYQQDHHWQTRFVPDSRALIALGLGPKYDQPGAVAATAPEPKTRN